MAIKILKKEKEGKKRKKTKQNWQLQTSAFRIVSIQIPSGICQLWSEHALGWGMGPNVWRLPPFPGLPRPCPSCSDHGVKTLGQKHLNESAICRRRKWKQVQPPPALPWGWEQSWGTQTHHCPLPPSPRNCGLRLQREALTRKTHLGFPCSPEISLSQSL